MAPIWQENSAAFVGWVGVLAWAPAHLNPAAAIKDGPTCVARFFLTLILLICIAPTMSKAQVALIEHFKSQPDIRWRFFTDDVMSGVSTGQLTFVQDNRRKHARMSGRVSTESNCGFLQKRMDLPDGAPEDAAGVRLGYIQKWKLSGASNGA